MSILVALAALWAVTCSRGRQDKNDRSLQSGSAAVNGTEVFQRRCARCHGPTGQGNGMLAATLSPPPPDFTRPGALSKRSDEQLARIIAKGGRANGMSAAMPAFEGYLSEEQIEALVKHLRDLSTEPPGSRE